MPAEDTPAAEVVALENESESGGNGVVLASFLAGFSALFVGAVAFFVGIVQRRRGRRAAAEESREASGGQEDASPPTLEVDIA